MRLFIAIGFDDTILQALTKAQDKLRQNKVRGHYTETANLHQTLAFIGEFGNTDLVLEAMEQVHFMPFSYTLSGYIGNFNQLLWAGAEQNQILEAIVSRLRHSLSVYHVPFNKKKFCQHITLLRKAEYNPDSLFSVSDVKIEKASMMVSRISLMRSERGKHGMIYTEIGSINADITGKNDI